LRVVFDILVLILPTCLLKAFTHADPKAQKDNQVINVFFCFWIFARISFFCKNVSEIDPWCQKPEEFQTFVPKVSHVNRERLGLEYKL